MKFELVHSFDCALTTFETALFHPELHKRLEQTMQGIKKIEPVSSEDDGRFVKRRVRYVPSTELPSFARGKIKPEMLEWIEESTYDRERHRFEYRIVPNIPPRWHDRFKSSGSYSISEAGGKLKRVIEGEVMIKVTLFGGIAERYVVGQVKKNFDQEADGLRAFLRELGGK